MFGHMGEGITGDLWRLDHKLDRKRFPTMPMAKNKLIRDYFANNIHITTSGHYSSRMLQACISEIGADRIQFAIDYPCECVGASKPVYHSDSNYLQTSLSYRTAPHGWTRAQFPSLID